MQFGFRPSRGTTDAIFILRQLQEKYLAKQKVLYFAFVDLEKALTVFLERSFGGLFEQLALRNGLSDLYSPCMMVQSTRFM